MAEAAKAQAVRSKTTPWIAAAGLVLILAGIAINWAAMRRTNGFDFNYLYVLARMLASGRNGYDFAERAAVARSCCGIDSLELQPYPPSTGVALLPFALLPAGPARALWFCVCLVTLLGGIGYLVHTLNPALDRSRIALILGLVASCSGVRWGFTILQAAPLLAGLFALFVAGLLRGQTRLALLVALLAIAIKPTYVVPFVAVLLLQRRFGLTAALICLVVLINAAGFVRMGGAPAYRGYRADIARAQLPSRINHPDPHNPISVERVDWLYAINAVHSDVPLSHRIGLALTALSVAWLVWEGARAARFARDSETLRSFLGPIVCFGTLFVYHNHYETLLLLIPALVYLAATTPARPPAATWWYVIPLFAYIGVYPVAMISIFAQRHFSPEGFAYVKATGAFVVLVCYAASCLALHRYVEERRRRGA